MSWDDNSSGFAAAHTALNSIGSIATFVTNVTSNTTVGSQTVQFEGTLTTAQFNGQTVKRIALHLTPSTASVTTASATLYGGVDAQTIAKTSDFSLITRLQVQHRST